MKRIRGVLMMLTAVPLLFLTSCVTDQPFYRIDTKISGYSDFGDTAVGDVLPAKTKEGWKLLDTAKNQAVTNTLYQSLEYCRDGLFLFARDGLCGLVSSDGRETRTLSGYLSSNVPYPEDTDFKILKASLSGTTEYKLLDTKRMESYPLVGSFDRMRFLNESEQKSYGLYRVYDREDANSYTLRSYLYQAFAAAVPDGSSLQYDPHGYVAVQSPENTILYYSIRSGESIDAAEWTRIPSEYQTLFYSLSQTTLSIRGDFAGKIRLTLSSALETVNDVNSISAIGDDAILIGETLYALQNGVATTVLLTDVRRSSQTPIVYQGFDSDNNPVYLSQTLSALPAPFVDSFSYLDRSYYVLQNGVYDDRLQLKVNANGIRAFADVSPRYFSLSNTAGQIVYYRKANFTPVCRSYGEAKIDTVGEADYFTVKTDGSKTQSALIREDGMQILSGNIVEIIATPRGALGISGNCKSSEQPRPLRVTAAVDLFNKIPFTQSEIQTLSSADVQNQSGDYAFFPSIQDVYSFRDRTLLIAEIDGDAYVFDTATERLDRFAGAYLSYHRTSDSLLTKTSTEYVLHSRNAQAQADRLSSLEYEYDSRSRMFLHRTERTTVYIPSGGRFSAPIALPQGSRPQVFGDFLLVSRGAFFGILSRDGSMRSDYRYADAAMLGDNLIVLTDKNSAVELFDGALNKILSNVISAREIVRIQRAEDSLSRVERLFRVQTRDGRFTLIRQSV